MKARFSEKQPSVLTKTIDGYLFVYICLNETKVEEEFENVKQTYYEYDYHEFKEDEGVLDVDAIIQNPSLFMDYPNIVQVQEKKLKEKIANEQKEKMLKEMPREEAVDFKFLYKEWESFPDGYEFIVGDRMMYKGRLFEVAKVHKKQSDWWPGKDPTLFEELDKDEHAGTLEDPIPVPDSVTVSGFTYIVGKYYTSCVDGKVYLCKRNGMNDGEKCKLNYDPSALIGHYFVSVNI